MGFRNGAYAKVWDVSPMGEKTTKLRISISRINKKTGEYDEEFSGFVMCIGTAAANKAAHLQNGSRIKIGDCDVTTKYDKEKKITYTNYKIFSLDEVDVEKDNSSTADQTTPEPVVDEGEIDDERLPF